MGDDDDDGDDDDGDDATDNDDNNDDQKFENAVKLIPYIRYANNNQKDMIWQ